MIYFNNAASSYPKPDVVAQAVTAELGRIPRNPYRGHRGEEAASETCRTGMARFFNVRRPERVVFCSGATEALNMVIHGLVNPGDRILTTQIEHNSVLRPLFFLRDRGDVHLDFAPCHSPGLVEVDELLRAISPETRLVIVNHASNVTGTVLDLPRLVQEIAARDLALVVDISQSAGAVEIDASDMDRVVLAFTGHKSLLGPPGTGGLIIGEGIDLKVWKTGGTGIRSESETMPDLWPVKFEAGTMNHPGLAGLGASTRWILDQGIRALSQKKEMLVRMATDGLMEVPGIKVWAAPPESNPCGVLSFCMAGWPPEEIGFILASSFDIQVRTGLHCAPLIHHVLGTHPQGTVRVSFSSFNTEEEVDRLIEAVKRLREIQ